MSQVWQQGTEILGKKYKNQNCRFSKIERLKLHLRKKVLGYIRKMHRNETHQIWLLLPIRWNFIFLLFVSPLLLS